MSSALVSVTIALPSQQVGFLLADLLAGEEGLYYAAKFSEDCTTLTLSSEARENIRKAEKDVKAKVEQIKQDIKTKEMFLHSMFVPLLVTEQGGRDVADMETLYHVKITLTENKLSVQEFKRIVLSFAYQDPVTHQYHFLSKNLSSLAIFRQGGNSLDIHYFPTECPEARPRWFYSQQNGQYGSFGDSEQQLLENLLNFGGSQVTLSGYQCIVDFSTMVVREISKGQMTCLRREPPVIELPVQHVVVNIEGLDTCIESVRSNLQGRLEKRLMRRMCPFSAGPLQLALQQQVINYCRQFCVSFSFEGSVLSLTGAEGYVDGVQTRVNEFVNRELLPVVATGHPQSVSPLKFMAQPSSSKVDNVPRTWIPQEVNCIFSIVGRNTEEWNRFEALIRRTIGTVLIFGLERVQNHILWQRYSLEGRQMLEKNDGKLEEKFLFHGTTKTDPYKIAKSESGIDFRCSSQARQLMWGSGAYFAVKASYSDQYSYKLPDGKRQMLIVSVFTGHSYDYGRTKNSKLTRPPERVSGKLYDTVHGYSGESDIYVVYDHSKSYPAYVVTYAK